MANFTVNDRVARVLAELQDGKQHVWKARNYRALYEKEVGVRPPYPRSRVALQNLQAELGKFKAAKKTRSEGSRASDTKRVPPSRSRPRRHPRDVRSR